MRRYLAFAAILLTGCAVNPVPVSYDKSPIAAIETPAPGSPAAARTAYRALAHGGLPDWTEHVITADKRGKFEERVFDPLTDACRKLGEGQFDDCQLKRVLGAFDAAFSAHLAAYEKALEEALKEGKPPPKKEPFRLQLFIHGGLVTEEDAIEKAKDHLPLMLNSKVHPIFLNWHTGPLNTYFDQITFIRNGARIDDEGVGDIEKVLQMAATPLHLATDIAEGLVRAPVQWVSQLADVETDLSGGPDTPPNTYDQFTWNEIDHDKNVIALPDTQKPGEKVLERAGFFLTSPSKIATMPFVDGLGKPAWDNMLRRSRSVLRTDRDFVEPAIDRPAADGQGKLMVSDHPADDCRSFFDGREVCYGRGRGPFARVLAHLESMIAGYVGGNAVASSSDVGRECELIEVSIVAHSMGAIVANDILRDFDLRFCNIVYMAAASSARHFYNTALPYIDRRPGVRFFNMMLHPRNDEREDYAEGLVPEGILLVWIDSFYEESDSVFDRTLGHWRNVARVKTAFPKKLQRCMIFKVFGFEDGTPTGHGAFNDVEAPRISETGEVLYTYNYWQPRFWGAEKLGGFERSCR